MAKQTKAQKETVERVMHEYKHGELKRGRGGKVKNPKQAIAIALHEAGASKNEPAKKNRENLKKTKAKERRGATGQAAAERKKSARQNARGGATGKTRADFTNRPSSATFRVAPRCPRTISNAPSSADRNGISGPCDGAER
jgi:hypothetical protein